MVESKHQWKAWLYLSPALVLIAIFTVWPIFNTVRIAFLEGYDSMKALGGEQFKVGFKNFVDVLSMSRFLTCLKNTVLLTIITVPLSTFIALLIAVCLNSIKIFNKTLQTIYFLPYVTNSIAIGMVFYQMFNVINADKVGTRLENEVVYGIIDQLLLFLKIEPINWINVGSSYGANLATMVIYIVWSALPFKILILLGGLQSVNKQYYDAAKIDGTSRARTLWRITVPLLSPMIVYVVITGFIGGFKEYTSIVGIFGDGMGPAGNDGVMNTMVGLIYDYINSNQGLASAGALILFAIIFVVTLINLGVSKKKTHY
jgi:multiple sugar transport system permease protein